MKKLTFLSLFVITICFVNVIKAQISDTPNAYLSQNVNQNPMVVTNHGGNYVAPEYFTINNAFYPKEYRNTFFATGIWLGGINKNKELTTAATTYITSGRDFYSGVLDDSGKSILLTEFNKIWISSRYDIEKHLADYADNQQIDSPINSIYAWAGRGNPFFKKHNGFELPDNDFAPFYDNDKDGSYNPNKGDFPLPEGVDKGAIPELITWTTYNDVGIDGIHVQSKGKPFQLEVNQTTWGYNCPSSNVINHTNFTSYKLHYKGKETIDSTFFGFWADPDVGCYTDDFIGCSPSQNVFFAYNQDEEDGQFIGNKASCPIGIQLWDKSLMPVSSVILLNQKMDRFMYFRGALADPPSAQGFPTQAIDFYRFLNNKWKDGSNLVAENLGYNPDNSLKSIKYAFPGNPNDSTQLSMRTATKKTVFNGEAHGLSIVKIGTLKPNQEIKIDVAFALHRKLNNTVSQNIDLMYKAVDSIQSVYNQGFKGLCSPLKYCSGNDCVYPGDVNRDGIVDYKDVVWAANGVTNIGEARTEPLLFMPLNAKDWTTTFYNGINLKNADADGDGLINRKDKDLVNFFYHNTTPNYIKQPDTYPIVGDDITMSIKSVTDPTKLNLNSDQGLQFNTGISEIQSIGFQLEFDSSYIAVDYLNYFNSDKALKDGIYYLDKSISPSQLDYSMSTWTQNPIKLTKPEVLLTFKGRQLTPIYPSRCTKIRIKNIVAFKKDGTPISLTAKDLEVCFTDITTGNNDLVLPNPLQVSPNPFDEQIRVKSFATEELELQLIDILGKTVSQQVISPENILLVSTERLQKGVYFLQCSNGKQHWTTKLVKN